MSEILNSGYVETGDDANALTGILTETSSRVTATGLPNNASVLLSKDFTAAHFGARDTFEFEFQWDSMSGTGECDFCIAIGNTLSAAAIASGGEFGVNFAAASTGSTFQAYAICYEGGVVNRSAASGNLSTSTLYYGRALFLDSLAANGHILVEVFSDSARTTLVTRAYCARTASTPNTYRYYIPLQTYSTSIATTANCFTQNHVLSTRAAGVDLTTYTKTGTHITGYTNRCEAVSIPRNSSDSLEYNYGAGWIASGQNFTIRFSFQANSTLPASSGMIIHRLRGGTNQIGVGWAVSKGLTVGENSGGTWTFATGYTTSTSVPIFAEFSLDSTVGTYGTIYLKVYDDSGYSHLLNTYSYALTLKEGYQYHAAMAGYGITGTNTVSCAVGEIVISKPASGAGVEAVAAADTASSSYSASPTQSEAVTANATQSATTSGAAFASAAEAVSAADAPFGALAGATDIVDFLASADSVGVSVLHRGTIAETLVLSTTINAIVGGLPVVSPRAWRIKHWNDATGKWEPATGLAPVYFLRRPSDMLWLDLFDGVFKTYGGCSLPKDTMAEDADVPGLYWYTLKSEQFSLNAQYYEFAEYYGTENHFAEAVVLFVDGVEQIAGINGTMTVDGALTLMQKTRAEAAVFLGSANTPPGAGSFSFKGAGGRVRVTGTEDAAGVRTVTMVDGTK